MSEIINIDYNVHNLFPTPIHCLKINDFDTKKQALIDYAYNLRDNAERGRTASNRGGFQSLVFKVKGGDVLQDLLIDVISNIPSFKSGVDVRCHTWVNINPPNALNVKHCHPNCDIAGVLWIKIPKNSGKLLFVSPYNYMCYNEMMCYSKEFRDNHAYHFDYAYKAVEGGLMLSLIHI